MKQPYTATRIDLEIIILNEEGQTEKQISYDIAYMCNLKKKWYKWTYLQSRNRLIDLENKLMVTKEDSGEVER